MGLLDGVLGGFIGGEMASLVNQFIAQQGGIGAIVAKFERQGLGDAARSWVGTGPNAPVTGDQVHSALGADVIQKIAAKTGLSPEDIANKLAQLLPTAIDTLTPNGVVPPA